MAKTTIVLFFLVQTLFQVGVANATNIDRLPEVRAQAAISPYQSAGPAIPSLNDLNRKIHQLELQVAAAKDSEEIYKDLADDAFKTSAVSRSLMIASTALLAGAIGSSVGVMGFVKAHIHKQLKSSLETIFTISTAVSIANLSIISSISESFTGIRRALVGKNVAEILEENQKTLSSKTAVTGGDFKKAHQEVAKLKDEVDLDYSPLANGLTLGSKAKKSVSMLYTLSVIDRILWEQELEELKTTKRMGQQIGFLPADFDGR